MVAAIVSGLIVSLDAFFIGLSLGLQGRVKYVHIIAINVLLSTLCFVGYILAVYLGEFLPFEPDLLVGGAFISLGTWSILGALRAKLTKPSKGECGEQGAGSCKTLIPVGVVMSVEAMLITIGITLIFADREALGLSLNLPLLIPATVAAAHFVYATGAFYLAQLRFVKKLPLLWSGVISGAALIVYGVLAIFT